MIKRIFDVLMSLCLILLLSIPFFFILFLVWLEDRANPIYISWRIGKGRKPFRMYKIRSMTTGASLSGVTTTSANDARVTTVGKFIRNWKIDELPQLINVIKDDMSLVGPRPNVEAETDLYVGEELQLFEYKPGVTDVSSIVFINEEKLLSRGSNPTEIFHSKIRPVKNKIAVLANSANSFRVDICVIGLTALSFISRDTAIFGSFWLLKSLTADDELLAVAKSGGLVLFSKDQ